MTDDKRKWIGKLRPFIADDREDGPQTVLVLKGFQDADEINLFMDELMKASVMRPAQHLKQ